MAIIVVMGATGRCGSGVAEQLLGKGHQVRVLGRSSERLESLRDMGADVRVGDLADRDYLGDVMTGADRAFTLLPDDLSSGDHRAFEDGIGEATVAALAQSTVRHVVFVSSLGADHPGPTGFIEGLRRQEGRLRHLPGINVVALRNGWFFENLLASLSLVRQRQLITDAIAADLPIAMTACGCRYRGC